MSGPGQIKQWGSSPITGLLSNFDVGQSVLKLEHRIWLTSKVLGLLQSGGSVWVAGFTSTTGSEARNQSLSDRRAQAVIDFLSSKLGKNFPVNVGGRFAFGEAPARLSGSPDSREEARWRAALVSAWERPTPPPPPPPAPDPIPGPVCKRTVLGGPGGVTHWAILNGGSQKGRLIEQVGHVRPTEEYRKCATLFERTKTFVSGSHGSRPVVDDYAFAQPDGTVGEVVGHVFEKVNRYDILARAADVRTLPKPWDTQFQRAPVDAFLRGSYIDDHGDFQLLKQIPLFLDDGTRGGSDYVQLAYSSEDASRWDLVTNFDGKIIDVTGSHPSSYPRSESTFHIIVHDGIKEIVKEVAKNIIKDLVF